MTEDLLQDIIKAALAAGADAAETVLAERQSLSVGVRLGALEEVEREESRDLGLRVFIGQRQAVVSGSDFSPNARARLIERAVAMARLAPEDEYAGLAPAALLARAPFPELDLFDPTEPSAEDLEDRARAAEDVARGVAGVTNSEGGSAGWSTSKWLMATSEGFYAPHRVSGFSLSASVIAGEGDGMERGGEGRYTRWQADLPGAEAIGIVAGAEAVGRLGARKIESTTAPIIFENHIAAGFLGGFLGAISGPSIARGTSFLKDRLGQQVFSKAIRITDDPHRPRGVGSSPYDDEGVTNRARDLVTDGVMNTWLLNLASAKQLGLQTTGHASRSLAGAPGVSTNNLTLQPGDKDLAALMKDAGKGLYITSTFGPSLNPNTGDWSVGVSGFWFENGAIAYPVNEVTVAGNLIDLYQRLTPGSDLDIRGASNAPSLLIDGVAIAGL
jgi:PmbA protein